MSDIEDENIIESEEKFIIEDIDENHKSIMDSLEKGNNIYSNSQNIIKENNQYNSNDINIINNINQENENNISDNNNYNIIEENYISNDNNIHIEDENYNIYNSSENNENNNYRDNNSENNVNKEFIENEENGEIHENIENNIIENGENDENIENNIIENDDNNENNKIIENAEIHEIIENKENNENNENNINYGGDVNYINNLNDENNENFENSENGENNRNSQNNEIHEIIENNDIVENNKIEGPIHLIEFNRKNFSLNEKALDILRNIKEDLIIVSIVGKARTGKSYLMNLLLNSSRTKYPGNGFEISSRLNSCTKGIWLWDTPRQKPNSSAKIIFIDSEGTNSVDLSTKTYDSKIFALIVLISSLFIYNTNGNIDEKSISELALAAHLSNTVAVNTIEDKDLIINELAPKFIWVLRDFILDKIDPDTGEEITSNEYLELCLRNKSSNKNSFENNLIRENIIKYFKERECVTLPRPVDKEEDLHKLNNIPFNELKSNFRDEFLNLKRKIYEDSKIKKIGNKKINGPVLVELLKSFIKSLNSKIIPNINTAIDNIIINDIEKSYENCIKLWKTDYAKMKEDNNNIIIKDLYDNKYFIMNEFNNVINENREIKYNKQYLEVFNDNKIKLENEIQNDIEKIKTINNNKKNSLLNDILNKHKYTNFHSNIDYNNLEKDQKNLIINSVFDNYSNFINDIKNNCDNFNEEKDLDIIINSEKENNINSIKNVSNIINKDYENKINEINEEINEDEIYINSVDLSKFENINETLNQRYELLSEELDLKEKEIFGLIGKYTKLEEEKEKIIANKNNMVQKRGDNNLTTLRSQKFQNGLCGITVESNENGCGCQLGDICLIF